MSASADNDIVAIGAGSCTLSSSVSAACSSWTLEGAASSSTTVTVSGGNIGLSGCNGKSFRITGINFVESSVGGAGVIYVHGGTGISYRIDHNTFDSSSAWHRYMWINEPCTAPGCLWDHNTIIDAGGLISGEAVPTDGTYPGCSGSSDNCAGHTMWSQTMFFDNGTEAYFEDNTFTFNNYYGNDMMDCDRGGRYVFRHNTVTGNNIFGHGFDSLPYSCLEISAYQNTIDALGKSQAGVLFRGGTGLIYSNILKNSYGGNLLTTNYRSSAGCVALSECPVTGAQPYCGGSNSKDGNVTNGWPCFGQVGRGSSPATPGLGSSPLYQWDNCKTALGCTGTSDQNVVTVYSVGGGGPDYTLADIQANRDYYDSVSPFNGTAGVGIGSLASRPSTCTSGVAYWGTDTNTLYQCSSGNTWSTYYTPYTYPHPLQQGAASSGAQLQPPTGLTATVN